MKTTREELKDLLTDKRTGLKDSSDTNKTYQAILGMFDKLEDKIKKVNDLEVGGLSDEGADTIREKTLSEVKNILN